MTDDLSKRCVCVVDHGLFVSLALRLSRDFGRTLYWTPWQKSFPTVNDELPGAGFDGVERIEDIWKHLHQIDCFVFPDIHHASWQLHLEGLGFPVWGSRHGDSLELQRAKFKHRLMELGLPVGQYVVCKGLDELREHLQSHENLWVKLSKFRGTLETFHHVNYELSEPMLDLLAVRLGPVKNDVSFVVESPVDTELEVGYDGFSINGQFPAVGVQGYEVKDRAFLASVQAYDEMPEQVVKVNEAIANTLKEFRYCNFFSTEIRVKDDEPYFIDPCCRMPSPSGEAQLELWGNISQVVWEGAHGRLLDPEPTAKFAAQSIIQHQGDDQHWRTLKVPEKTRQWVKLYNVCQIGDTLAIPPSEHMGETVGSVIGLGDTIADAIAHLKENVEAIKDQPITANVEALVDALKEVEQAEEQGIEFTDQKVPKPESVLQDHD